MSSVLGHGQGEGGTRFVLKVFLSGEETFDQAMGLGIIKRAAMRGLYERV
jgi:hypothetical protein